MIMSENTSGSAAPNNASGESLATNEKDSVAYSTYSKAIGEVKSLKAKLNEMYAKDQEREQSQLAEQGKFKEQADSLAKRLKEYEQKFETQTKTYAKNIFSKEAKNVALQMGAMQEALDDLIKTGDWSGVDIGENFEINTDQLKDAVAKMQKTKPFYFKKTVQAPVDVNVGHSSVSDGKKDLSSMSKEELIKLLKT